MNDRGPFHEGEIAIQQRVGDRGLAELNGRVIASTIPRGALSFLSQQHWVILASVDESRHPWASMLVGPEGFAHSPDETRVDIDLCGAAVAGNDPVLSNLKHNPAIGLLAIEFDRRRRLRINGRAERITPAEIRIRVDEAYPNCPKYVQRRHLRSLSARARGDWYRSGRELGEAQIHNIRAADTMFVASVHPDRGADASHRGGKPGFVQVIDRRSLRVPDYAGNSMYNTLGNVSRHPFMGAAFLDFDTGRVLQLSGTAAMEFDKSDPSGITGGTNRFWRMDIERWHEFELPVEMEWERLDASPLNPPVVEIDELQAALPGGQGTSRAITLVR